MWETDLPFCLRVEVVVRREKRLEEIYKADGAEGHGGDVTPKKKSSSTTMISQSPSILKLHPSSWFRIAVAELVSPLPLLGG